MNIDKEKCNAWCKKLIEFMEITKTINRSEARYIKSNLTIAVGRLELEELKKQNEII